MSSRPGSISDDELLTQLAASFAMKQTEPDASSLQQLSLAVAQMRTDPRVAAAPENHLDPG